MPYSFYNWKVIACILAISSAPYGRASGFDKGPDVHKQLYAVSSPNDSAPSLNEFLASVSVPSPAGDEMILVRWPRTITILLTGIVGRGTVELVASIANNLGEIIQREIVVTTNRNSIASSDPYIMFVFRDQTNAAETAKLLSDLGYTIDDELERGLQAPGAEGSCFSLVNFDSESFEIYRSIAVVDLRYQMAGMSSKEAYLGCIFYNIFHSLGLLNNDAISDSVVSNKEVTPVPTAKDILYLATLYDKRIRTGPIDENTKTVILKLFEADRAANSRN